MRRPLIAGNWKMNGSRALAVALTEAVMAASDGAEDVDVVLCPPAPYLNLVASAAAGRTLGVGAQDCSEFESGAYTGETAAPMLRDVGCSHVIIGHSERRQFFGDTDERIAAKIRQAYAAELIVIFCVGETLEERKQNATESIVARQLEAVTAQAEASAILGNTVIAYEPVWAIGTGESAAPDQAQRVHSLIRARLAKIDAQLAETARVLYGGSVKPENAAELFAMPDIDGALIGGASLKAESFMAICRTAAS